MLMPEQHPPDEMAQEENRTSSQWIDGRVLDDEPIIKTSDPYKSTPEYLCPHCACNISGSRSAWSDHPEEVPDGVQSHIRECGGLKTYHLGLRARRRQKAKWLAQQRNQSDN